MTRLPRNASRIAALAEEEGLDAILVLDKGFGAWATGLPMSVFGGVAVIIWRDSRVTIVTHALEYGRVERLAPWSERVLYGRVGVGEVKPVAEKLGETLSKLLEGVRVGCEKTACNLLEGREHRDVTGRLWGLRMVKEEWELERMKDALRVAEEALVLTLRGLVEGATELEVAGLHEHLLRRNGSEGHAFVTAGALTIVAFGANTAHPHWDPGLEPLRSEQPVLIDTGAVRGGYVSDITRSFWYGDNPDPEWSKVFEAVEAAVGAALDAVEPGIEAGVVDEAARKALGGYARYFIHGTGHGLGVEVHEPPRVSLGSKEKLEKGMVFTIEPGVYIPGRFGVRLEQMVVVDERGARLLNRLPLRL